MQRWSVIGILVGGICANLLWQIGSVNAQSFDRALCQKSTTSTGASVGPDPFWAVYDGRSMELVACETTGVAGTLTCNAVELRPRHAFGFLELPFIERLFGDARR